MPSHVTRFTFRKDERLSSRKIISKIFEEGRNIVNVPFRLLWIEAELSSSSPAQVAFAVPAKKIRLAVDRNRIRRQMREVYRKNKSSLYSLLMAKEKQCAMMIVFTGAPRPSFEEIEKKLKLTLLRFEEDFKKHAQ